MVTATLQPFYPRKIPGTHCTGGWVGPRVGLDGCGKSRPHRDLIPDRSACTESLYRLSCLGPHWVQCSWSLSALCGPGLVTRKQNGWSMKLTAQRSLVPRLRMPEALSPLSVRIRDVMFKHRDNFASCLSVHFIKYNSMCWL